MSSVHGGNKCLPKFLTQQKENTSRNAYFHLRFELCLDFSVLELDLDVEDKTAHPVLPTYGALDVDGPILCF